MEQRPQARLKVNTWLLPIVLGLILVMQLIAPYRGWIILLVGLGGALLVGYLWAWSLKRGLHLTREMRFGWAQVGDQLEERFTVTNERRVPALWMEVVDHSTMPGYELGRATGVDGRESIRWRKEAVCVRRGLFALGPTTLLTGDPFGLFTVSVHYPASMPFLVVPPVVPLPMIEVATGGRAGEGYPRPNAPERTVSAASVREYIPGDSMRWVHWRTSAHRDSLFVRLFEGIPAGDWWIVLDMDRRVQVGKDQDSTEEHGVILAASLADKGLRLGRAVGLAMHGQSPSTGRRGEPVAGPERSRREPSGQAPSTGFGARASGEPQPDPARSNGSGQAPSTGSGQGLVWLRPQGGEYRRWEILRALALVSPGDCSLAELLTHMGPAFGQHASLVIITPAVKDGWVEALVPMVRRGTIPTILLLDPVSFEGEGDVREMTALFAGLGVAHYVITSDLLSRPELQPDQQGHWEWRVLGTGRARPVRPARDLAWKVLS